MDQQTIVNAGQILNDSVFGGRIISKSGAIKLQVDEQSNTTKHICAKTGYINTQKLPSGKNKSRDKIEIDVIPLASNKYQPQENDVIIGVIIQKSPEFYLIDINSDTFAHLNAMDFQNATKRDKPNLPEGTLIFCRVLKAEKYQKAQLTCISLVHKKAWNTGEAYFGQISGGYVRDFSIAFCRRMISDHGQKILEKIGSKMQYDINIGYNGKIWVNGARPIDTIFIFNALERIAEMGDDKENVDFIMEKLMQ